MCPDGIFHQSKSDAISVLMLGSRYAIELLENLLLIFSVDSDTVVFYADDGVFFIRTDTYFYVSFRFRILHGVFNQVAQNILYQIAVCRNLFLVGSSVMDMYAVWLVCIVAVYLFLCQLCQFHEIYRFFV